METKKMICQEAKSGECKIECEVGEPHLCKEKHPFSDTLKCIGFHGKNRRFMLELKCVPVEE